VDGLKKVCFLVVLTIAAVSLASVASVAERLPADSHTVLVIEGLKENYAKSKEVVLMDMILNQLAIEQLVAQYVEMLAYNNGLDPKDIYKAFDGDLGLAVWRDSSGDDRLIAILGPMKDPKTLKSAAEKILPQLLPVDFKIKMATDNDYLYVGDIDQYSQTARGFDSTKLIEDLPAGFGYLYSEIDESLTKASFRNQEELLVIETLTIPTTEESREAFRKAFAVGEITDLEDMSHLPLVSIFARLGDLGMLTDYADQLTSIPLDIESLALGKLDTDELGDYLTGDFLVDVDLSVDDIFASLMGSQGTTSSQESQMNITYVARVGFIGSLDIIKDTIEKSSPETKTEISGETLIVEGQYMWIDGGWLFISSKNKEMTVQTLDNSAPLLNSTAYVELSSMLNEPGFARFFVDSGYVLTGLMGMDISSGLLFGTNYLAQNGAVKGILLIK
jgi:hypothetical protein